MSNETHRFKRPFRLLILSIRSVTSQTNSLDEIQARVTRGLSIEGRVEEENLVSERRGSSD